jgi:hypothetical protein
MKRKLALLSIVVLSANLLAQTTVNKTTVEISKDFKKSEIVSAQLSDNNQLEIVLAMKKKKEVKMLQYTFDQNVNKIDEKELQYDVFKTKNNELPDGQQKLARFVRIVPSSLFLGTMQLEKGYIERTYMDYRLVGESFETESSFKVETDDGRKINAIASLQCGGTSLTTKDFGLAPSGYYASGDLVAIGEVMGKLVTKGRMGIGQMGTPIDYVIVKASAKTLNVESKTLIPFKYVQRTLICKEITDKRLMLITKDDQTIYKGQEEFYNKGSNTHTVTIISKDGVTESQFTFEGIAGMDIINAEMLENGNIYLIAREGKKKELSIVAIKLENQKLVYCQKTLISVIESVVVKPSEEKKVKLFSEQFPNMTSRTPHFRGILELGNKNMVAVYQDEEKTGRLYYLQFDEGGKLIKQYTHTTKEGLTATDGNVWRPIQLAIHQTDHNVFYPVVTEKKKDGNYFSIAKIDCNTGVMSNFTSYGTESKEDKNEYFLDNSFPAIDTNDGFIIIGRTSDKGFLWINKVKLE